MKKILIITLLSVLWFGSVSAGEELTYKKQALEALVKQVPRLLGTYDSQTGHFGRGIWICTDQNRMYPLAAAYAYKGEGNRYYKDKGLLEVIMKAGDALIEDADEQGQWEFRKKDGSTWGKIRQPWIYSRWMRAYWLISEDMPAERRQKWVRALKLGFGGISERELKRDVHNIPAHHAMGLYVAGKSFNRPDWCERAGEYLRKVVGRQAEGGYWSENFGPVVGYNFVYVDALGTYYAMSGDRRVFVALERAAKFHYHFRYPNGERVETIDERNPYKKGVDVGNVGFTFTPTGRAYLKEQWRHYGWERLPADLAASLLLYGEEGPVAKPASSGPGQKFVLKEDGKELAATVGDGPWFVCLSAYASAITQNRWMQDRQNFVSIYHEKTGPFLGGGNTKLQPAWSNFTVGDMKLLRHKKGDEKPDFSPKGELYHVPSDVKLVHGEQTGLDLTYGPEKCRIRIRAKNEKMLEYVVEATTKSKLPVAAHLTLLPLMGEQLTTGGGEKATLGESQINWNAEQVGGKLSYGGYRLHLPETASVHWPALGHNPYRKDGHTTPSEGRVEIRIVFDEEHNRYTVMIEILK
ncbi:MAG: hypothetical protein ACYS1A_01615 [Planctomycetota bacterium]|jgi:hypothetical protein